MGHKYDAAKARKRRIHFLVAFIAGTILFGLAEKLLAPATPLEVFLFHFTKIVSLLVVIMASVGMLANLIEDLVHDSESKESATMKDRANRELCYAAVTVNHYYQLMVREIDQEDKARFEVSYHKAREDFQSKARMFDVIFQTQTVLVEGKDDEGNIIEVTFDSHSG